MPCYNGSNIVQNEIITVYRSAPKSSFKGVRALSRGNQWWNVYLLFK